MIEPYYKSPNNDFLLAKGDSFKLLQEFDFKFVRGEKRCVSKFGRSENI